MGAVIRDAVGGARGQHPGSAVPGPHRRRASHAGSSGADQARQLHRESLRARSLLPVRRAPFVPLPPASPRRPPLAGAGTGHQRRVHGRGPRAVIARADVLERRRICRPERHRKVSAALTRRALTPRRLPPPLGFSACGQNGRRIRWQNRSAGGVAFLVVHGCCAPARAWLLCPGAPAICWSGVHRVSMATVQPRNHERPGLETGPWVKMRRKCLTYWWARNAETAQWSDAKPAAGACARCGSKPVAPRFKTRPEVSQPQMAPRLRRLILTVRFRP